MQNFIIIEWVVGILKISSPQGFKNSWAMIVTKNSWVTMNNNYSINSIIIKLFKIFEQNLKPF